MATIFQNVLTATFLFLLIILMILCGICFIKIMLYTFRALLGKTSIKFTQNIPTDLYRISMLFLMLICLLIISQHSVKTPEITGENAISELRKIELNGRTQWISIRGQNKEAPVLLFLAGGPGGTQLAAVRHTLSTLEKHFIVIGWDQPGSGKSYESGNSLSPEDYIKDGEALTHYLIEEFNQNKITLVGESWGSYLGLKLVEKSPDIYERLITTGQMVDFLETELIDYAKTIELSFKSGDFKTMNKLITNGKPPYYGKNVTAKTALYINYLTNEMNRNLAIHNPGYDTMRDLMSPEYSILDKINFFRGILYTFNDVYQQLYDIDLRENVTKIEVPIMMIIGRHDLNAPTALAEEYYNLLDAPQKKWIWFEHSGHSPWINESNLFIEEVIDFTSSFQLDL